MSTVPELSIIIPVKNGGAVLDRLLSAIYRQKTNLLYEVIAIDSGSTDGSLEILKRYPVRLVQIQPEEFSHSRTRNYGASLASASKYYVFLNQDAVPVDDRWLGNLISSIESEPDLMAVCATELDEKEKVFNVSGVAAFVFRSSLVKGIYTIEPRLEERWQDLPGYTLRQMFPFTTVCAIFDKEHFDRYPFSENVPWGEDLHWAVMNSRAGFKSACSSYAQVYHCHSYSHDEINDIVMKSNKLFTELFGFELDETITTSFTRTQLNDLLRTIERITNIQHSSLWTLVRPFVYFRNKLKQAIK